MHLGDAAAAPRLDGGGTQPKHTPRRVAAAPPSDDLTPQQLSDWYRVAAISKYGGVWLDASSVLLGNVTQWVDLDDSTSLQGFYSTIQTALAAATTAAPENL